MRNGAKYGVIGKGVVRRSNGGTSLGFSRLVAAVVTNPNVRVRAGIVTTVTRIEDFIIRSRGALFLLSRGNREALALGGRWRGQEVRP